MSVGAALRKERGERGLSSPLIETDNFRRRPDLRAMSELRITGKLLDAQELLNELFQRWLPAEFAVAQGQS